MRPLASCGTRSAIEALTEALVTPDQFESKHSSVPAGTKILALDVGDRRIGMACSDPTGLLASPIGVYRRVNPDADIAHIVEVARKNEAEMAVVGLPINMDGSEGHQAEKTRSFAQGLADAGLIVDMWDERLSTVEATRVLREQGMKPKRIESIIDEMAAVIILEGYLRAHGPRAVPASGNT